MKVDKRKKFGSANVMIKKVIFQLGLERFYIWQKWRRKQRETGYRGAGSCEDFLGCREHFSVLKLSSD